MLGLLLAAAGGDTQVTGGLGYQYSDALDLLVQGFVSLEFFDEGGEPLFAGAFERFQVPGQLGAVGIV